MRIVHTCLRYPPATGGVETYVHELVERTRNIDVRRDVRVLTSAMRTHGPISALSPDLLLDDPPYVQRLPHAATWGVSYPRLQSLNYYLGHHRPDVVHGYSFWYQPADTAARYARRHHIPFILHPIYYTSAVRRKPLWRFYQALYGRKTFAAADAVAVISRFEQRLIEKAALPVKRFVHLPPGVELNEFAQRYPNPFVARGVKGRIVLAVGRVTRGKGLDDILEAVASAARTVADIQLVVIGEDFGRLSMLKEKAAALGITSRVHWWGRQSRETLLAAYQHADVFVHGSYYEAFGIVLIEALAAGLPVIARDTSAVPEIVAPGKVGELFTTTEELAQILTRLLSDPDRRQRYGKAGQTLVAQKYSWDQTVSRLLKLYEELIPPQR